MAEPDYDALAAQFGGKTVDYDALAKKFGGQDGAKATPASRPLPANAGLAAFGASLVGLPMDTVENVANLGIAGYGAIKTALTGQPGPELLHGTPGTTENVKAMLRSTGAPGLSPDNPTPESKMGTAQYDFVARGGVIPGGAMPAAGSIIAEKIGGPQWAQVGAMAPAAISATVGAIPRPKLSPKAALLDSENVSLTPGQIIGGSVQRAEDAATSIPVIGDAIKGAQRRGIESFDAAAINRALAPIGDQLPKHLKGRQAVEYAYAKLGDAYDSLLPNLKGDMNAGAPANALPATAGQAAPRTFKQDLDAIKTMGQSLPPGARRELNDIIKNEVVDKFTPSGLASGETLKAIESELNTIAKAYRNSESYGTRQLGKAVEEIQASMRRMVENVNQNYRGELAKVNEGYANFKKVQAAAANIGALDGVFTPAQLQRAVRAGDTTKDKRAFSEGDALMQDLSEAGKSVLSSTVPDSGTPMRSAVQAAMTHPLRSTLLGIPIALGAAAYSSPIQAAMQSFLTSKGGQRTPTLQELTQQAIIANQR